MQIDIGFTPNERAEVTALYWEAFSDKLGFVMGPRKKGLKFVNAVLNPTHAIVARDADGTLLGVVGFKTYDGALVGGEYSDLRRTYGLIGSLWRALLLQALERDTDNERFLLDGIFVSAAAQGQGVGTALLEAVCREARDRGYTAIRLDVINTNPRAKSLYERRGFEAISEQKTGLLEFVFGFKSATTMVRQL
jgi:ribosomal protein S18 acetylase RimI-like enzyme